jgi:hypothetical protein
MGAEQWHEGLLSARLSSLSSCLIRYASTWENQPCLDKAPKARDFATTRIAYGPTYLHQIMSALPVYPSSLSRPEKNRPIHSTDTGQRKELAIPPVKEHSNGQHE